MNTPLMFLMKEHEWRYSAQRSVVQDERNRTPGAGVLVYRGLELVASVLGPGFFIGAGDCRIFFAITDDREAIGSDAHENQIFIGRPRPAFAKVDLISWASRDLILLMTESKERL